MHCVHTAGMSDASLSELATALNDLYRLSSSPRFHDDTVRGTRVQISRSGLRFLSLVADEGPISGSRLASALDLSQPTASRALQQLEADGLVTRQASSSDGRVSYYLATTRGRRVLAKVHAFHVSQLTAALHEVAPERRAALAGAVTELVERLHPEDLKTTVPSATARTA